MNFLKYEKRSKYSDDVVNELTRDMDRCLHGQLFNCSTYIYPERIKRGENKHHMAIKYPGETVGYIVLDTNDIIQDIVLYDVAYSEDSYAKGLCLYNNKVRKVIKKYIGYKIEF